MLKLTKPVMRGSGKEYYRLTNQSLTFLDPGKTSWEEMEEFVVFWNVVGGSVLLWGGFLPVVLAVLSKLTVS